MRDLSCEIFATFCIVATVLLSQFIIEAKKACSMSGSLFGDTSCGKTERCVGSLNDTGVCECLRNYQRQDDKCVPENSTVKEDSQESSSGGTVAAGLLIPLFLISLGMAIFFGARRYKWVQRFRQYQQNRYGNVLVTRDDDDDDPPIV